MARRRLTPAQETYLAPADPLPPPGLPPSSLPPIAHVAAEASATAALAELGAAMTRARAEGRLVEALPLEAIDAHHLCRDRLVLEDEAMLALAESIRAHGQRVPIEVTALGQGRYGLIAGLRRLTALGALRNATGDAAFATVLALVRQPADAAAAYVAMVEENEIRQGLSYYERAQIAARAAEAGAFPSDRAALAALFAGASRARRSKIGSFLTIHHALGDVLRFPAAIPERLGLRLSAALADPARAQAIRRALEAAPAPDAAAETAVLGRLVARVMAPPEAPRPALPRPAPPRVTERMEGDRLVVEITGATPALRKRLLDWLAKG